MSRGIRGGIIVMFAMISNWLFQDSIHFMGRKCENYFMKIFLLAIELLCHQLVVKYSRLCNFYFNFMNELLTTPGGQQGRQQRAGISTLLGCWEKIQWKYFLRGKFHILRHKVAKYVFVGAVNINMPIVNCYVANFYLDNLWLCIFRYLLICQFVYLWIYFVCG